MKTITLENHIIRSFAIFLVATASCVEAPGVPSGLEVSVAPLTLPGVVDACYTLTVKNDANQTVSTRNDICASRFGANGGITYIATCDATDSDSNGSATNTVTLTIDGLYAAANKTAPITDFINPCSAPHAPNGCQLSANCVENADAPINFNLTLMREANQGFFDIGVNFDDIFCSAKLDCTDGSGLPLNLLHHPATGQRGQTAVVALACTTGPGGAATHLLRDPIKVTCGSTTTWLDPAHGRGNIYGTGAGQLTDPNTSDSIWQYAIYAGSENLDCGGVSCDKRYWNIAIGFNATATNCRIQTTASAIESSVPPSFSTPAGANYPVITWDVALTTNTTPGTLACGKHPLNGSPAGVTTAYTGVNTSKTFIDRFDGTTLSVGSCPAGYSGSTCTTPVCAGGCGTHGSCTAPNTCTCESGWSGANCQNSAASLVTSGLVLHLDAGQSASYPGSGTSWTDLTSNAYVGALSGGVAFSSFNGGILTFDGSDDSMQIVSTIPQTMNTISVWVRMGTQTNCPIVYYGSNEFQSNNWTWGIAVYPNNTHGFNEGPMNYPTTSLYTEAVNTGTWKNFTLVRNDAGHTRLYKNGVLVGTKLNAGTTAIRSNSDRFIIGRAGSIYGAFALSNVLVYDRALSAAEVLTNFNALKGRFGL